MALCRHVTLVPKNSHGTYLGSDIGRYDAQQQLFLLLLFTLQFDPRLDAGPRAHKSVVVSGLRHVSVIQPDATRTQQEECLSSNLWQQRNFIWV